MYRSLLFVSGLLFAMASSVAAQTEKLDEKPVATPVSGKIDWVFDYAEGQRLSKSTSKPMFVVFRCER